MSILQTRFLAQCTTPGKALQELCAPFPHFSIGPGDFAEVVPEQVPQPYRQLLVHGRHMTRVLGEYHGAPVDVYVMDMRRNGDCYSRKIFLTERGDARAIELGVARVHLSSLRQPSRDQVLQARRPLGAVLAENESLRRIEPRWYLRFPAGSAILRWFGYPREGPFYGRIASIYCGDEPAIEVLEIVTLWE